MRVRKVLELFRPRILLSCTDLLEQWGGGVGRGVC